MSSQTPFQELQTLLAIPINREHHCHAVTKNGRDLCRNSIKGRWAKARLILASIAATRPTKQEASEELLKAATALVCKQHKKKGKGKDLGQSWIQRLEGWRFIAQAPGSASSASNDQPPPPPPDTPTLHSAEASQQQTPHDRHLCDCEHPRRHQGRSPQVSLDPETLRALGQIIAQTSSQRLGQRLGQGVIREGNGGDGGALDERLGGGSEGISVH